MRGWLLIGAVAGGCSFSGPGAGPDGAIPCETITLGFGEICAGPELPSASIDQPARVDTTTGEISGGELRCVDATLGGREVCAVWFAELDVSAELRVFGARPLVIVASRDLRVNPAGAILAGSGDVGGVDADGPGANPTDCEAGGAGADGGAFPDPKTTYGGGGGGGFGSPGGDGGTGRSGQAARGTGGSMTGAPSVIRGGCRGGAGGTSPESGSGGSGGGALYLATLSSRVRIDGRVDAAGAGGSGGRFVQGTSEGAGGGGGSGGMIAVDGGLSLGGTITAAGGGGGEGGEADGDGQLGNDGEPGRFDNAPAAGGSGAQGADGGDGATPAIAAQSGDANDDGGGGGGGGVGVIVEL